MDRERTVDPSFSELYQGKFSIKVMFVPSSLRVLPFSFFRELLLYVLVTVFLITFCKGAFHVVVSKRRQILSGEFSQPQKSSLRHTSN
jgi:hypothetical protein